MELSMLDGLFFCSFASLYFFFFFSWVFAIIAERDKGAYKLYYNGNKKKQGNVSVRSYLTENTKQAKDNLLYIQLQLEKELISYAPYKGATMWGQAEYAQNILDDMITNGVETH